MLSCLSSRRPEELLRNWPDGRIKMFLTQQTLRLRTEHKDLFQRGTYLPLRAVGAFADCCIAFARDLDGKWIVAIAPRLSSRVGFPPIGDRWKDTAIELPKNLPFEGAHEIFTGRDLEIRDRQIRLADAMLILPFAMVTH
jgi:(1->4)-alpha-D-glucan 1-alpha-D-glucosylmutase